MHIQCRFPQGVLYSAAERRLIGLQAPGDMPRAEMLFSDEFAAGYGKPKAPQSLTASTDTDAIVDRLEGKRVKFLSWVLAGFSKTRAMKSKFTNEIKTSAEKAIADCSDEKIGFVKGLFFRGQREKYLKVRAMMREQIRQNALRGCQDRLRARAEGGLEQKFGALAGALENRSGPMAVSKERSQEVMRILEKVGTRNIFRYFGMKEKAGRAQEATKALQNNWKVAARTAQTMFEQLYQLGVVTPLQFKALIVNNQTGGKDFEKLVMTAPQIPEGRRDGLRAKLKELRRDRKCSGFLLLEQTQKADLNVGTLRDRLKRFRENPLVFMTGVRFSQRPGLPPSDMHVVHRSADGKHVTLEQPGLAQRYVIDTMTGTATGTNAAGGTESWTLSENSLYFSKLPQA